MPGVHRLAWLMHRHLCRSGARGSQFGGRRAFTVMVGLDPTNSCKFGVLK